MRIAQSSKHIVMPSDTHLQASRREAILEILVDQEVTRQVDLVRALAARGMQATQSSVSRDLKELGVVKVNERYLAPQSTHVRGHLPFEVLAEFVREIRPAGPNITVINTATGAAQSVAYALDESGWQEIAGTLSGDDTIFVATVSHGQQQVLLARLDQLFPGARQP
jgi:transcriptional regulator of arginine metabolism